MPDITTQDIIRFGQQFAREHMPKYETELLTVACKPSPNPEDEISKHLWGRLLFTTVSKDSYCRQFIFENNSYRERTLEEITTNPEPKVTAKKVIAINKVGPNLFRIHNDGAELAKKTLSSGQVIDHLVGQGRYADAEWNGSDFTLLTSNKLNTIT